MKQKIKIKEQVSNSTVGSIPRSLLVVLQHDVVDSAKAGESVVVTGVLIHRWTKSCYEGVRCELENILQANSIRLRSQSSASDNPLI